MKIVAALVLIILLTCGFGWLTNLPQDVGADVPEGKLNSLSFAPFREGQGPMEGIFPTPEQVEADLRLMAEKTHSIRTYASAEGTMPVIPALARKHGVNMIQGAWIGSEDKANQKEIQALISAANAYPDVIKRVIVGNEVLLRGELKPEQLINYIRAVKQAVKQPVSYADVWSKYMEYPQLIKEVDFITIHILPYWEDEPIAVEVAPAHIERIYKLVQREAETIAPNKPILIGESGWPSAGRQRGWAIPSVVNEAGFIRGLIKVANENNFDYNIVEALNQSWKSQLEGVVGGNWGLFSVDRQEVFPLTGQVYEHAQWFKSLVIAIVIFLVAVGYYWTRLPTLPTLHLIGFLVFLQLLAVLLVSQIEQLWYTSYSDWQRLQTVLIVGLNTLLGALMVQRSYDLLAHQATQQTVSAWLYRLYLLLTVYAAYKTYGLAFNGRYISFPQVACYIPVVGMVGLLLTRYLTQQQRSLQALAFNPLIAHNASKNGYDTVMGYVLIMIMFTLVFGETKAFTAGGDFILAYPDISERIRVAFIFTLGNCQLISWLACLGILALPLIVDAKKSN